MMDDAHVRRPDKIDTATDICPVDVSSTEDQSRMMNCVHRRLLNRIDSTADIYLVDAS